MSADTSQGDPPQDGAAKLSPYDAIGGAETVGRIVERFYDLMDSDPDYAALRAMHADNLDAMRASLKGFLAGWLGGPRDWFAERPGLCIMSLHHALPVTEKTGRQWLEAMARAMDEAGLASADVDLLMRQAFARMAQQMQS